MTSKAFGLWTVIKQSGNSPRGMALWLCACACGTEKSVAGADLRSGKSLSCGCAGSRATLQARATTHGMTGSKLHHCWKNMLSRCRDTKKKNYGAKGITVCKEWESFAEFKDWAGASGYKPNLTIERLNNDLGYEPANCTWADRTVQARNRSIVKISPDGRAWAEIAEQNNVPLRVMNCRFYNGKWPIEIAATWPVGKRRAPMLRDALGRAVKKETSLWKR